MKNQNNRKRYNNLVDSIAITILLGFVVIFPVLPISLALTGNITENTDPERLIKVMAIMFGSMCIMLLFLMIKECYGYYIVYDDKILYRNLYCRKTILYKDIKKIEIKEEWVFTYKTDVLSIYGEKSVIKIYIYPKNEKEILNYAETLKDYITIDSSERGEDVSSSE